MLATQQLTEFLSAVADRPDGPAAQYAAVECAARALEADVAVLIIDSGVVASVGLPAEQVPLTALQEAAAERAESIELAGLPYALTHAHISGPPSGLLILGRRQGSFSDEEICLLRGMARVLELSLQALHVIEAERRQALENGRLVDSLQERQRLFEHLSGIQRLIARRAPLQQILDQITSAAAELLGLEMASLNLLEKDDPSVGSMVSHVGFGEAILAKMKRVPLPSAGVAGLAVMADEMVMVEDYENCPIAIPAIRSALKAVMAVPVHENGEVVGCLTVGTYTGPRKWDKSSQEILRAFAEHVSLALTDAQTLAAMNQAFHDSLTGLASRALFLTRMERAFTAAGEARTGTGVLFVDLDRFKVVNDSLGHAAGDVLLVGVAERIRACLRPGDTAARLGGDEFAVLLPMAYDAEEAVPVAQRILEALREPFVLAGKETFVSCSIGIAYSAPGELEDAHDLMVRADLAMYQAKKQGKDRLEMFEPAMQASFQAGLQLEADLRRAVMRHEFELRYQPIVHLRTGEITGLEALVRWQHPERGLIPPLDFIPLAEETGMIVPIGEWVLREACRQAAAWNADREGKRPLSVSVNMSAVQLDQPELPEVVASALEKSGLPAACLVIELTESLLVDHRPTTLRQLERIKELGIRLAIDDFGTGYSSLAYLRRFPVDIIKIDKSFVDDVGDVPAAAALTLGIIQLGQALSLSTIAEGIEDAGQLSELADGNCELGQGYYFAEPLNETAMGELLSR
ncbi:putative bifunctional diguanylate cyclase/phosphodiesterase [Actinoplanes sp. NPDC049681]|uniref:putative bifunctional diguanylate cyclase/phosphodiesterase n=1 Tax=Actinoplanes sp. NPDC049681 TaxID=3363905 RepID=UPI0037895875